jgi:hypothetical protein
VAPSFERRALSEDELPVDRQVLAEAAAGVDFVVLPERIREVRGSEVAPFRHEVQQLRAYIRASGRTVALAVPEGAETAAYQEHAAEWVLPIVLFTASIPVGVACNLFANWIWSLMGPKPDSDDTVHVRLARELPDGTLEMLEVRGRVEDVVRVLRESELESGETG